MEVQPYDVNKQDTCPVTPDKINRYFRLEPYFTQSGDQLAEAASSLMDERFSEQLDRFNAVMYNSAGSERIAWLQSLPSAPDSVSHYEEKDRKLLHAPHPNPARCMLLPQS